MADEAKNLQESEPQNSEVRRIPRKKASDRRKQLRQRLWPEVLDEHLWIRTQKTGFTTIPRTMTLIMRIMDTMSGKGVPVAMSYLTLWCWTFDEGLVEIRNPKEFAYESGFSGPRAESLWKVRMRRLEELGFIRSRPGLSGDFHFVLLLNPILVIEGQYKEKPHDLAFGALLGRLVHVGADDLDF
ncbi:hypothetical protein AAKU55_005514 [Oxalobacteraceae bacterium GrIS 1.11]